MNPQQPQFEEDDQPIKVVSEGLPDRDLDKAFLSSIVDETLKKQANKALVEEQLFNLRQRQARLYSESGLFEDKKAPPGSRVGIARALVKIELGESMGFSGAEALHGIAVVNGVTCIMSALRASRMQALGWGWDIFWHGTHEAPTGVTLWLTKNGAPHMVPDRNEDGSPKKDENGHIIMIQASEKYLKSDAQRMMTTIWEAPPGNPNGKKIGRRASILEKDNWVSFPRNMFFARCVTNAQRFWAPGALSVNLMSVEEALDLDTVIDETEQRGSREEAAAVAARELGALRSRARVTQPDKPSDPPKPQPVAKEQPSTTAAAPIGELADFQKGILAYKDKIGAESFAEILSKHGYMTLEMVPAATHMAVVADMDDKLREIREKGSTNFKRAK